MKRKVLAIDPNFIDDENTSTPLNSPSGKSSNPGFNAGGSHGGSSTSSKEMMFSRGFIKRVKSVKVEDAFSPSSAKTSGSDTFDFSTIQRVINERKDPGLIDTELIGAGPINTELIRAGFIEKDPPERSQSPITNNHDKIADDFFDDIIKSPRNNENEIKNLEVCFIVVCHITPSANIFLRALKKIGEIALLIPKSSFKSLPNQLQILEELKRTKVVSESNILGSFDNFKKSNRRLVKKEGLSILKNYIKNKKFIIIDTGGYFASVLEKFITAEWDVNLASRFLGIIEDTENGHQKYELVMYRLSSLLIKKSKAYFKPFACIEEYLQQLSSWQELRRQMYTIDKVYSIARSPLKACEDYNVGESITEAVDTMLRSFNTKLNAVSVIGVIGYGKIGQSIAHHLRGKHVHEVLVYDHDEIRLSSAANINFKVADSKEYLLKKSDVIFLATGNHSLNANDIVYLKDGVCIASCTSREDEMSSTFYDALNINNSKKKHDNGVCKYTWGERKFKKSIYLLNDGNAVNFLFNAVNGPSIYSVLGSIVEGVFNLLGVHILDERLNAFAQAEVVNKTSAFFKIKELPQESQHMVAKIWIKNFVEVNDKQVPFGNFLFINRRLVYECYFNELVVKQYMTFLEQAEEQFINKEPCLEYLFKKITVFAKHILGYKSDFSDKECRSYLLSLIDIQCNLITSCLKKLIFPEFIALITRIFINMFTYIEDFCKDDIYEYNCRLIKLETLNIAAIGYSLFNKTKLQFNLDYEDFQCVFDRLDNQISNYSRDRFFGALKDYVKLHLHFTKSYIKQLKKSTSSEDKKEKIQKLENRVEYYKLWSDEIEPEKPQGAVRCNTI